MTGRATTPAPTRTPTEFERRVYVLCKSIPKGKVSTYGAMAKVLSSAPRAVGQVRALLWSARGSVAGRGGCVSSPASRIRTLVPRRPSLPPSVQALRRNPYAPVVPCHRVVAASLELGGFSGQWGCDTPNVRRKRALLEEEGVKVDDQGRLADRAQCLEEQALRRAAKLAKVEL